MSARGVGSKSVDHLEDDRPTMPADSFATADRGPGRRDLHPAR